MYFANNQSGDYTYMANLRVGPLVRSVSATSVVIWAELTSHAKLTITARSQETGHTIMTSGTTVLVGGHYYIALQLQSLQSATWYEYQITMDEANNAVPVTPLADTFYGFRTLHPRSEQQTLRVAYGSCRKSEEAVPDAFIAFGSWLRTQFDQREQCWPHVLLLIGDQIYADQPPSEIVQIYPHMKQGAITFEDFSLLYQHAWTYHPDVRQALATIPTYMIFDDHEITNNLNFTPTWRAKMLNSGQEQVLIDGFVAYWVYQGWGNLDPRLEASHPLLSMMHAAAQNGEDILEQLRAAIKADIYQQQLINWHYQIPTQPSIFVMNARTERTTIFDTEDAQRYEPTRMISQQQMKDLQQWLVDQNDYLPLMVSSVPILLPPAIGFSEYIMGQRPLDTRPNLIRWSGRLLARLQQKISEHMSFDHWPLYAASWKEFVQAIQSLRKDVLILSGDVHFSYSLKARFSNAQFQHTIYQFVSTPLQNALDKASYNKIELQGRLKQFTYGGLRQQILPLLPTGHQAQLKHHLLFENTIAIVTIQQEEQALYQLRQEYMGIVDGKLQVIGKTVLSE
jgi:phosphodiesterase/alkaline phosphatase D-like protein